MKPLPDDHPAWRVIGAWIAARQRGEPRAILRDWVAAGYEAAVAEDVELIATLGGEPLRTGGELVIGARAVIDASAVDGLQIVLRGKTEAGEVVARLGIRRIVDDAGVWRIAALLTDDERRAAQDPAFRTFMATARAR